MHNSGTAELMHCYIKLLMHNYSEMLVLSYRYKQNLATKTSTRFRFLTNHSFLHNICGSLTFISNHQLRFRLTTRDHINSPQNGVQNTFCKPKYDKEGLMIAYSSTTQRTMPKPSKKFRWRLYFVVPYTYLLHVLDLETFISV